MLMRRRIPGRGGVSPGVNNSELRFGRCEAGTRHCGFEQVKELLVGEEEGVCSGCVGVEVYDVGSGKVACEKEVEGV